jgi:PIN domain nuclease of toxin-antitoxin system
VRLPERVAGILDTAPLVFAVGDQPALVGRAARRFLHRAAMRGTKIGVSTVSLFEIAQLEERGRVSLGLPFDHWCQLVEDTLPLLLLPLERSHVSEARAIPALHDPFDRLIAGTAIALGVPLISSDDRIARAGRLRVIW